ncbi:MAG: UDP-N-acetylmuramoyl-L-alanine--D-glutamate ligase [Phycisphaerales bacterium]
MSGHAVIMGLGAFGGGIGAARHLLRLGFDLTITDTASTDAAHARVQELDRIAGPGVIRWRLGGHHVSDFTDADLVVVNPAVKQPWDNRFVRAARASGARLTTEIALTIDAMPASAHLLGVTGTAGKSTTAAMVHAGLRRAGTNAVLGGNIGGSLLDRLGEIDADAWVVLELSSAMLWWLDQPGALESDRWPEIGVVTNLSPNHLDWHGSEEHYRACKQRLVERIGRGGAAVLGAGVADWQTAEGVRRVVADADDAPDRLATPGAHNRRNAGLALAACRAAGAEADEAVKGIAAFRGLPHRLELIREHRGVRWYNDSKSTTPDATRIALDAMDGRPTHLIVGGSDKGIDLTPIAELRPRTRSLLCIGQMGETIAALAGVEALGTLDRAVHDAAERARPGEAVLLSPGCASFDQFTSYEHRGAAFAELVRSLL